MHIETKKELVGVLLFAGTIAYPLYQFSYKEMKTSALREQISRYDAVMEKVGKLKDEVPEVEAIPSVPLAGEVRAIREEDVRSEVIDLAGKCGLTISDRKRGKAPRGDGPSPPDQFAFSMRGRLPDVLDFMDRVEENGALVFSEFSLEPIVSEDALKSGTDEAELLLEFRLGGDFGGVRLRFPPQGRDTQRKDEEEAFTPLGPDKGPEGEVWPELRVSGIEDRNGALVASAVLFKGQAAVDRDAERNYYVKGDQIAIDKKVYSVKEITAKGMVIGYGNKTREYPIEKR